MPGAGLLHTVEPRIPVVEDIRPAVARIQWVVARTCKVVGEEPVQLVVDIVLLVGAGTVEVDMELALVDTEQLVLEQEPRMDWVQHPQLHVRSGLMAAMECTEVGLVSHSCVRPCF